MELTFDNMIDFEPQVVVESILRAKNVVTMIEFVQFINLEEPVAQCLTCCPLLTTLKFSDCQRFVINLCAEHALQVTHWIFQNCFILEYPKQCRVLTVINRMSWPSPAPVFDHFFDQITFSDCMFDFVEFCSLLQQAEIIEFKHCRILTPENVTWPTLPKTLKKLFLSGCIAKEWYQILDSSYLPPYLGVSLVNQLWKITQRLSEFKELQLPVCGTMPDLEFFFEHFARNTSIRRLIFDGNLSKFNSAFEENRGVTSYGKSLEFEKFAQRNLRNHNFVRQVALCICWGALFLPKDMRRLIAQYVFATRFDAEWDASFEKPLRYGDRKR